MNTTITKGDIVIEFHEDEGEFLWQARRGDKVLADSFYCPDLLVAQKGAMKWLNDNADELYYQDLNRLNSVMEEQNAAFCRGK